MLLLLLAGLAKQFLLSLILDSSLILNQDGIRQRLVIDDRLVRIFQLL